MSARPDGAFDHRVAVHGSDDEFVAVTVPFLLEGIAAEHEPPPLMISSPAKMDLVRDALGRDREQVTFIPSSSWYDGSAPNTLAKAAGYIALNAGPSGAMHAVAEPDWTGRAGSSAREIAEWVRYEAMLNLLLAPLALNVICPYDTRAASPEIIDAARRTHPTEMHGPERRVSTAYQNPMALMARLDAAPLPPRPADARAMALDGNADAVCRFVGEQARSHGLNAVEAGVFESAVAEVLHMAEAGVVYTWPLPPRASLCAQSVPPGSDNFSASAQVATSVCEVFSPTGQIEDLLIGFRPPDALEPQPGQGLWFTRQVCDYVDIRSGAEGWTVRIQSS
ncbi:anti-sigma regulatory factor [Lentzea sp. NBRC 105346]|uniref:MEDS domain-containing protein n=1 Tax=Lentzea sp. NBRC 105346 TaxID=3032205 RepID=UPI0024A1000E|nr:MEDS domain-containing protein [Lentzea sp. NBRC 105346]GLZ29031.1 anti-sigma regulatory factor [Lentzea sp. NBRC 105346]